jgi:outer membrane immunogenic protein
LISATLRWGLGVKRSMSRTASVALASVSALAISAAIPAHAQVYSWSGFYIGGNAGGFWGQSDVTTSAPCIAPSFFPPSGPAYFCTVNSGLANGLAIGAAGSGSLSDSGFTGGGQAGFNWQNGNGVIGLETDFGAFHFRGSQSVSAVYPTPVTPIQPGRIFTIGTDVEANWLFTLRGRVGWAVQPNLLVYGTGGLAVTNLQVAVSFSDNNGIPGASGAGSSSSTKLGWAVGGGFEYAFDRNWTAKIEYLFVDFGSVTTSALVFHRGPGAGYSQAISTSADLAASIVRGGINYKF